MDGAAIQVFPGKVTSGQLTFMSSKKWPAWIPLVPPSTQARPPTDALGPRYGWPFGPVRMVPRLSALPTLKALVMVELLTTSPCALFLVGSELPYVPQF